LLASKLIGSCLFSAKISDSIDRLSKDRLTFALSSSASAFSIIISICIAGCAVKVPFVHTQPAPNGPDYTTTYSIPQTVPIMFKMDGKRNLFAAKRGHLIFLDKNATVFYFRPRAPKIAFTSLNAQVLDIWASIKAKLPQGDLDVLILRCMPHNPTLLVYNYVFVKDDRGQWARVKDEDYLNHIIESQF